MWDLRGRDAMCTFKGHKTGVTHVKFSPDGKWVASASDDGQVKVQSGGEGGGDTLASVVGQVKVRAGGGKGGESLNPANPSRWTLSRTDTCNPSHLSPYFLTLAPHSDLGLGGQQAAE